MYLYVFLKVWRSFYSSDIMVHCTLLALKKSGRLVMSSQAKQWFWDDLGSEMDWLPFWLITLCLYNDPSFLSTAPPKETCIALRSQGQFISILVSLALTIGALAGWSPPVALLSDSRCAIIMIKRLKWPQKLWLKPKTWHQRYQQSSTLRWRLISAHTLWNFHLIQF